MSEKRTRRQFIGTAGTVSVLALAGCSDGGSGTEMETETNMDDETMGDSMDGDMTPGETMEEGDGEMEEGGMSEPTTFTVRIENVAPTDFYGSDSSTGGAIWISPGAWAVHEGQNPIYTEGEAASIGLEAQAEAGPPTGFDSEPGLVEELEGMMGEMGVASAGAYTPQNTVADPNDPMGEVPGAPPIAPGGAFEFDIEAEMGQKLSVASMFVPSNDLFLSPGTEGIPLFDANGDPMNGDVTDTLGLWDAGTEPNGEPGYGPDQAPTQDSATQGADEGGVVRPLSEVDDGYTYPDVSNILAVTLTPQ